MQGIKEREIGEKGGVQTDRGFECERTGNSAIPILSQIIYMRTAFVELTLIIVLKVIVSETAGKVATFILFQIQLAVVWGHFSVVRDHTL